MGITTDAMIFKIEKNKTADFFFCLGFPCYQISAIFASICKVELTKCRK